MTQCCYETHREDPRNFPKIDVVATSLLLRGNMKGISTQNPNAGGRVPLRYRHMMMQDGLVQSMVLCSLFHLITLSPSRTVDLRLLFQNSLILVFGFLYPKLFLIMLGKYNCTRFRGTGYPTLIRIPALEYTVIHTFCDPL